MHIKINLLFIIAHWQVLQCQPLEQEQPSTWMTDHAAGSLQDIFVTRTSTFFIESSESTDEPLAVLDANEASTALEPLNIATATITSTLTAMLSASPPPGPMAGFPLDTTNTDFVATSASTLIATASCRPVPCYGEATVR